MSVMTKRSLLQGMWLMSSICRNVVLADSYDYDKCTAIAVGKKATVDGSVMTTHTADCAECDWRINKVPASDWPEYSQRPVYLISGAYPRQVREDRGLTWSATHLENIPNLSPTWKQMTGEIIGYIPQVRHTYALIEGLYGIMNEYQVSIGESTCAARSYAAPVKHGGRALLEASELSQIALERSKTAREAIMIMGELAEKYGFYSAEWEPSDSFGDQIAKAEGGEALTVIDPDEAWMFHIVPDPTGTSAVWVAQLVPDDHITVVANSFVIREVDPESGDFLYSSNLWSVAESQGWWTRESGRLDFKLTYGQRRQHYMYCYRRVWRVFSLAAPSLALPPETDQDSSDYPFSVKVDSLLSAQDLMRFQRDHYEGTAFSTAEGIAAGPYGDPNRFDPASVGDMTLFDVKKGEFPRTISLFRTSYSFVAQARVAVPNLLSLLWLCQYAPDSSTYTPLYVASTTLPEPFTRGAMQRYSSSSAWWNFCVVGNYAARFYKYAMLPVRELQRELEEHLSLSVASIEQRIKRLLSLKAYSSGGAVGGEAGMLETASPEAETSDALGVAPIPPISPRSRPADLIDMLTEFTVAEGEAVSEAWALLFPELLARFRDGYVLDINQPTIGISKMFYPRWWLEAVGFFNFTSRADSEAILFDKKPRSGMYGGGHSLYFALLCSFAVMAVFSTGYLVGKKMGSSLPDGAGSAARSVPEDLRGLLHSFRANSYQNAV